MNHRSDRDGWPDAPGALVAFIGRAHRDEHGTALTEFIIILPIFILIFAGITHLARLNQAAIRVGGTAYSQMWDKAKEVQTGDPGIHISPLQSGQNVRTNAGNYRGLQEKPGMQQIVRRETESHGNGLSGNGHVGESFARVGRVHNDVEFRHIDGDLTKQVTGTTGDSAYAKSLFSDAPTAQMHYPNSAGALGSMDSMLDGHGLRPVLAAGMRYGTVIGSATEKVDVAGQSFEYKHYFTTLVAPTWRREDTATSVARTAMNGTPAYDNLLGIAEDQPLDEESISAPKIEGRFGYPDN